MTARPRHPPTTCFAPLPPRLASFIALFDGAHSPSTSAVPVKQPSHPVRFRCPGGRVTETNVGLDVDDRCAVDRIQPADVYGSTVHALELDRSDSDRIRAMSSALREDTNQRHVRTLSRPPNYVLAGLETRLVHEVHDDHVGESL